MKDRLRRRRWGWGRLVAAAAVAVPLVPVGARPALAQPCQQGSACTLSWRNCRASGITNTMQDGTLRADLHVDQGDCHAHEWMQASRGADSVLIEGDPYDNGKGSFIFYTAPGWRRDWTTFYLCDPGGEECGPTTTIPHE